MGHAVLFMCTAFSCFIIIRILWEFINRRYHPAIKNKYFYFLIGAGMLMLITVVHILGSPLLNLLAWGTGVALSAWFLYDDSPDRPVRRIILCEVFLVCIGICNLIGMICGNLLLRMLHIQIESHLEMTCFQMIFSKIAVIFLYDIIIRRRVKSRNISFSPMQYFIYFAVFIYTIFNTFVFAYNLGRGPADCLLTANLCCAAIGELCLLYLAPVINKKNESEYELRMLKKQAEIQYEYYVCQEQNYNKTIQILHDVNKHIKSIEQLYLNHETEQAKEYTEQMKRILTPLMPVRYTGNAILDILLTDKTAIMNRKSIDFDIKINHANLAFLNAVDVTTIFGNLLDNAIEACEEIKEEKSIYIEIKAFHEMITIRIKNSSPPVKWKNGFPISEKGNSRGIGLKNVKRTIEMYDGDMKLQNENGTFIVDIFLNS